MPLHQAERRRAQRMRLQIPLFLSGTDTSGVEFLELTKTLDISSTGAFVASRRALNIDQLVRMTIPVSAEPASGLIPSETTPIQARVRRLAQVGGAFLAGLQFLKALD
jgi:hypothetical protein